jgi:lyso-ornithine lipid O-acyltransferase
LSFRAARRAVALGLALVLCVVRFWLGRWHGPYTLERRALWLQSTARLVMASLGIRARYEGRPPIEGLVVANHLSYLDIVILSAAMPCFFVAKVEIDGWPFFGEAARSGGTIFLDRASRSSAHAAANQISERLKLSVPVLLFPEGTSSDGSSVLRFHSRLIDPATTAGAPITAAAIRYVLQDGTPERDLCWFGDEQFLSHLWKVLGKAGLSAEVRFGQPRVYVDRRVAAETTHAEIQTMREVGSQTSDRLPSLST